MGPHALRDLLPPGTKVRLSSSSSSATKKSILSSEHESPWTSNVLPSSIHLIFPTPITEATHIALTFQGGFVCTSAMIYVATKSRDKESLVDLGLMMGGKLYPEDRNRRQIFEIPYPPNTAIPANRTPSPFSTTHQKLFSEPSSPSQPTSPPGIIPSLADGHEPPIIDGADGVNGVNGAEEEWLPPVMTELKIEFEASSDQYGRITVYQVEVLG